MNDIWTMVWKETKGSVLQGGRTAAIRPLLAIGILGLLLPWQLGQSWLALSPAALLLILYVPFLFTSMSVGDAIAGERERHTLETLLASRISDRAILLGKILVTAGTAWGMALASLLFGMVAANLASGQGRWVWYGSFVLLLEALALSLLTSLLATSAGVLISLRATTVRQAQQTLALSAVVLLGVLLLATRAVPEQVLLAPATSTPQLWLVVIAVLVVLDAILLGATFVGFQRSRLI
ncbi:MAG TPA: ABC transporter permease [Ktedonobacteraceae bacterium]|nr:ABC transporter permease [Ktedonobacteraceae bacterium]